MTEQNRGDPQAALAIWDWQKTKAAQKRQQAATSARIKGVVEAVVGGGIGTLIFFLWSQVLAYVVFGITGFVLLAALASPLGLFAVIGKGFGYLGIGVGIFLTWLLLVPLYWLMFTPFGLLARRGKKDKMQRWYEREAPSYWKVRDKGRPDAESYEQQF